MRSVCFTVPGRIGGKGRPRFDSRSHVTYTPHKTHVEEGVVKHFAHEAMTKAKLPLLQGPLHLSVAIRLTYPKSWTAKKCAATVYVTGKPDPDNQIKLLCDSLNGIVWIDDAQVAQVVYDRRYIGTGTEESVEVTVRQLSNMETMVVVRRHLFGAV